MLNVTMLIFVTLNVVAPLKVVASFDICRGALLNASQSFSILSKTVIEI
jgi:hypothetical protein